MDLKTPDYLKDATPDEVTPDALARLEEFITEFKTSAALIEELEDQLKLCKERFKRVEQEEIPTLLREYGLSEVRLKSGEKVIVKEQLSASVPKEKEEPFFTFLKDRNEEDIIKLHFHFSRMPQEKMLALFAFLNNEEYDYDSERGVHSQTLKKYFKELLGIGDEERAAGIAAGKYLTKEAVSAIANVFTYFSTTIK